MRWFKEDIVAVRIAEINVMLLAFNGPVVKGKKNTIKLKTE